VPKDPDTTLLEELQEQGPQFRPRLRAYAVCPGSRRRHMVSRSRQSLDLEEQHEGEVEVVAEREERRRRLLPARLLG